MRRLPLVLVAVAFLLTSCAVGQRNSEPPPPTRGAPNATCPNGWTRVSQQAWVQQDRNGDGVVDFPQSLPAGGGGHLHVEFCAPLGVNLPAGNHTFQVDIMSHQGFAGEGDKVDVGLAPGGDSLGRASAPSMTCGPKPEMCHGHATVTFNYPGGDHNLRVRYLPAHLPNGERWFVGGELPVGDGSGDGFGGKSWLDGYANARFKNWQQLVGHPLSGTVNVDLYSKGDAINNASVHVDARFGSDDEGWIVARRGGEFRGGVPLDTTRLTNGWHCLAARADADAPGGGGRVHTGVIEVGILVQNSNPGDIGPGRGGCFPS